MESVQSTRRVQPLPSSCSEQDASSSVDLAESAKNSKAASVEDDDANLVPWIPFECSRCSLSAKCFFKELRVSDGFYASPVFYMRDPLTPPPRIRGRRPVLADFVVLGALCRICEAPVCLAKSCSLYFGSRFCSFCVLRERRRFPEKLVEIVEKAQPVQKAAKRDGATEKKKKHSKTS